MPPSLDKVVHAIVRHDVAWLREQKPRKKWRRRASRVVTQTFMQHHPPGMFTELCRLGFQFIHDRCCSEVSTPSHVCHGVAFPDYVIEEERLLPTQVSVGGLLCALRRDDIDHAARVARIYGHIPMLTTWDISKQVVRFCDQGRCGEVISRVIDPLLCEFDPTDPIQGYRERMLICRHQEESLARLRRLIGTDEGRLWKSVTIFIYVSQQLHETLWFVYNEGAPLQWGLTFGLFMRTDKVSEAAEACRRRYRALVTDMVAKHLPVVGVPELVANYTPTPFDVEQ